MANDAKPGVVQVQAEMQQKIASDHLGAAAVGLVNSEEIKI